MNAGNKLNQPIKVFTEFIAIENEYMICCLTRHQNCNWMMTDNCFYSQLKILVPFFFFTIDQCRPFCNRNCKANKNNVLAIIKQNLTPFISKFVIGSVYYLLPFRFRSHSLMTTKQMITKASNSTYGKLNKVSVCDEWLKQLFI